MIYKSKDGDIDLSNITRLYPAAVIDMYGEIAEMSLEWMEDNEDKVKLVHFVLVFDATPHASEERIRTVLTFDTKDELIECMTEVSKFFDN
ncbi:MAG: hypothetical protein J7J96_01725 [Sulfurimonas sp.]|nr:hypothetical protein [Sulfurimonas sp.]